MKHSGEVTSVSYDNRRRVDERLGPTPRPLCSALAHRCQSQVKLSAPLTLSVCPCAAAHPTINILNNSWELNVKVMSLENTSLFPRTLETKHFFKLFLFSDACSTTQHTRRAGLHIYSRQVDQIIRTKSSDPATAYLQMFYNPNKGLEPASIG